MSDEKRLFYDHIDMRNSYNSGFWLGAVAGIVGMFGLCLMVGLFFQP